MSNSGNEKIEVVKQRIAKLELQAAEVQTQLYTAHGFFGRWRLSAEQIRILSDKEKFLLQKIKENAADLKQLYAPPPTTWQSVNSFEEELGSQIAWMSTVGGIVFASWRYWSIMRMRFAPLRKEQWDWRKVWLQVESPFPPAVKLIMFFSAAHLALYYSRHPPQHEFLLTESIKAAVAQMRTKLPDRIVIQH